MPDPTVPCGIPECPNQKKSWQACCLAHWRRIPKPLRDRVWSLYRSAPGSGDHLEALMDALEAAAA